MAEPIRTDECICRVVRTYVPALHTRTPAYGISSGPQGVIVHLSDKAPEEVAKLLEDELNLHLKPGTPAGNTIQLYAERLTHDYLSAQVISGNLRYDKVTQGWRWLG